MENPKIKEIVSRYLGQYKKCMYRKVENMNYDEYNFIYNDYTII